MCVYVTDICLRACSRACIIYVSALFAWLSAHAHWCARAPRWIVREVGAGPSAAADLRVIVLALATLDGPGVGVVVFGREASGFWYQDVWLGAAVFLVDIELERVPVESYSDG